MLYNKNENRKINEKKVLHKVRKHWVTVSVALLSLIGVAGMAENNVHASSINANHQNNNAINNNSEHKTNTLVKPANNAQQINPNQRSLNLGSANAGHQVQSIHQFNRAQLTKQTSVLRDRILSQLKTSPSQSPKQAPNQSASVTNSNDQAAQTSQNLSGYYGRSANNSVSSNSISSSAPSASQASPKMARINAPRVGDDATDASSANSSAISDISDKFGQVSNLTNQALGYIAQAKSASTVANAQLNRYSDIDPKSVNSDSTSSDFGSASDYAFSDSSDAAKNYNNKLVIDMEDMPSAGAIQDSIKAQFASSMAGSLSDQILDSADNLKYQGKFTSLANQVDMAYAQAQDLIGSMSNMALDATNQVTNISNAFSSASSVADSAGVALNGKGGYNGAIYGNDSLTDYAIANVDNATELINAIDDSHVHQINITKGISTWSVFDDSSYKEIDAARNLTLNGLNNDGTYNSVDWANYNFNMTNAVTIGSNTNAEVKVLQKNMNVYGINYFGPGVTANNGATRAIQEYHNINFVGAQLTYARGASSVLFTGKDNICAGQSYSPTGMYTHPSYPLPKGVSLYPGIIKDGIDTSTGQPVKMGQTTYTGKTIYDSQGNVILKKGTQFIHYNNMGSQHTPDLAIDSSRAMNDNMGSQAPFMNYGIDIPCDQQIVQITGGNQVRFSSDCQFNGMTTDSDGLAIDSTTGTNGNSIRLNPGANVHITPNGANGEGPNGESGNYVNLPSAIHLEKTGELDINPNATLNITPSDETLPYCTDSEYFEQEDPNSRYVVNQYMPAALNFNNGGTMNIASGGTFSVKYPKTYNYNLPGNLKGAVANLNPLGAVSLGGSSRINAYPYSHLLLDAGGPTKTNEIGNLVALGPGNTASNVNAETHSDVELSTAGAQQIMLFSAPDGTTIKVNDPQQFSLDLTHNTNTNSQLAGDGVSIEGDQVTGYDQPNQNPGADYDKFDHSFGQYDQLVLPGKQYDLPKDLMYQIEVIIQKIQHYIINDITTNKNVTEGDKSGGDLWDLLGQVVWGTDNGKPGDGVVKVDSNGNMIKDKDGNPITYGDENDISHTTSNPLHVSLGIGTDGIIPSLLNNKKSTKDALDLFNKAKLIPFGSSGLKNNDNNTGTYEFNHSIDLPYIIASSIFEFLESSGASLLGGPFILSYNGQPMSSDAFGDMVARSINGTKGNGVDGPYYYNSYDRDQMFYDTEFIPIHHNGFNITKGFAFKGVPQAYVEGVKVQNGIISGYAQPGSYIKIQEADHNQSNKNNDYDNDESNGSIDANTTPIVPQSKTINDHNYDNDDDPAPTSNGDTSHNKNGYLTTAQALGSVPSVGYWSYKLPKNLTQDQINNLVVTAHTATVGNKNSAREATYYMNGLDITRGRFSSNTVPADQETPQPKNTINIAPNGADYAAYLSNDHSTLTVTGNFDNYGNNGIDGNGNQASGLSNVENLNLGNAWNIKSTNKMFKDMTNLYTINQIGNWNTNDMQTATGTFDKDDQMNAQYVGPIVSSWGNSSLTKNNMGNGQDGDNDDPQYNGMITIPNTSQSQTSDPIIFVYNGHQISTGSINGYLGATYNIDADQIPNGYVVDGGTAVTLSGHQHYINVEKVGSPIYIGDTVSGAEAYYQNTEYFPASTYPHADAEVPTKNQNDPTYTDDDDAGSYSTVKDNKGNNVVDKNGNPIYRLTIYKGNERQSYYTDDTDAGRYFEAGRLKGILDLDNLATDNSIYTMPNPFIIGYLTAKSTLMTPRQLIADINKIIKHVQHVKGRVDGTYGHPKYDKDSSYYDYKPKIWSDMSSADVSSADDKATMASLGVLLEATSPDPSHPYDPYENLKSVNSDLQAPNSSAGNYDSLVHDQYSDVSQIDDRLGDILDTLDGYRNNLVTNAGQFNQYQDAAKSAAKNQEDAIKQMNVLEMNTVSNADNDIMSSASDEGSSANVDESSASNDNQAASSNSNAMLPYYDSVRGSASNNEADDFNSVAQSYTNSAQSDEGDVYRDSTEVSHRDRQLSVANGIFEQDEAQINEITNSLEDYVPLLSSLNGLGAQSVGSSLSTYYSNDYSAANSALNFLNDLANDADTDEGSDNNNSGTANQDSSSATWASNNLSGDSQKLAMEAKTVSNYDSMQNNLVKHANFDQAQFINGQAYQSLDSKTDSQASYDVSLASSAWVQIHNLHDKIAHGEGMVEEEMPMFNTDIQNYAHLVNSASANHENSASQTPASDSHSGAGSSSASAANDRYQGTFTVTVQDEDAQGNHTSRDIETISVDKRTGTQITLDPQQYQPSGFHSDPRNHPSIITVTRQGVMPHNVTFYYRIDHDNDSNGVQQASQTPASSSSSDSATFVNASQSSVPSANSASSDSSSDDSGVQGAPIWIDGDQEPSQMSANWENDLAPIRPSSSNESSSASAVSAAATSAVVSASSSVSSSSSSSSSSRTIQQIASSVAVRDSRSASASASVAAAVHAQSASAASSRSERSSASSSSSSAVSHVRQSSQSVQSSSAVSQSTSSSSTSSSSSANSSSAASQSSRPQRNSLTMIRHQFLKRYEDRALKIPDTSRTPGAQVADRYIAGINDARKNVAYQAKDRAYHTGYHAFRRARIKSMTRNPQQASHHWSLAAALLLVLSTILSGLVAADHRCY